MSTPAAGTYYAARLRRGDVLTAYGNEATVSRTPVVSVDGSMYTVVMSTPGGPKLVRIPADQPVQAVRPVSNPHYPYVRKDTIVRSSGTRVLVLDLAHLEADVEAPGGERYATLCTTHHSIRFHTSVSTAEAQGSHPEEWCASCTDTTRQRAQSRVYGPTGRRTA